MIVIMQVSTFINSPSFHQSPMLAHINHIRKHQVIDVVRRSTQWLMLLENSIILSTFPTIFRYQHAPYLMVTLMDNVDLSWNQSAVFTNVDANAILKR